MRLGIQLLNNSASLNNVSPIVEQTIRQGETSTVVFQLVDLDQNKLRYVPGSGATAFIEIPRFPQATATILNQRVYNDYSVRKYASMLLPSDDRSIWTFSLSTTESANLQSSGMRVTVTDNSGASVLIAYLPLAFRVYNSEIPSS